jgi:hypothetical protein
MNMFPEDSAVRESTRAYHTGVCFDQPYLRGKQEATWCSVLVLTVSGTRALFSSCMPQGF